jgi:hypothetical protein
MSSYPYPNGPISRPQAGGLEPLLSRGYWDREEPFSFRFSGCSISAAGGAFMPVVRSGRPGQEAPERVERERAPNLANTKTA